LLGESYGADGRRSSGASLIARRQRRYDAAAARWRQLIELSSNSYFTETIEALAIYTSTERAI
jgi:hypothetical protein